MRRLGCACAFVGGAKFPGWRVQVKGRGIGGVGLRGIVRMQVRVEVFPVSQRPAGRVLGYAKINFRHIRHASIVPC